ncbi:MAG: hypothetical protein ACKOX6_02495 [Bdellovibrio sp.]
MVKGLSSIAVISLIAIAMMVSPACSFKKNPDPGFPQINDENEKKKFVRDYSLDGLFSKDEEQIISELISNFTNYELETKRTNTTFLDAAIKYEKPKVIDYLLLDRSGNPFEISQSSYNILEFKPFYNELISAYQKDRLIEILKKRDLLREEIQSNKLGATGCQKFASFLIDEKFNQSKSQAGGTYFEVFSQLKIEDIFQAVMRDTSCSDYTKNFSTDLIKSWMTQEFLFQFQHNFASPVFLKFLGSLKSDVKENAITFSMSAVGTPVYEGATTIAIEPFSAFVLKLPCMKGMTGDNKKIWADLIERYGYHSVGRGVFSESEDPGYKIKQRYKLYLMTTFRTDVSEESFNQLYMTSMSNENSEDSKLFIRGLCGGANESN